MNKKLRLTLCLFIALMLLAAPFVIPSGAMLGDYYYEWMDYLDGGAGLLRLLIPSANAESADAAQGASYALPIDFSPGCVPNPAAFTQNGYQDDSLTVTLETVEQNGVQYHVAYVQVKHASQLRTGIAGNKVTSSKVSTISSMAAKYNAVIAINGDYYANDPPKTSFEYRMGQKIRSKRNRTKDLLIIDENGDFNLFVQCDEAELNAFNKSGRTIVNAFTFGPAMVKDGNQLELNPKYGYNPHGDEPRMAIGQMGELSYVIVFAEGRTSDSQGVTHQELADFMFNIGCLQAFNLDGGGTAEMVFNGKKSTNNERSQSDIIYFATAVDPATWRN